MHGRIWGGGGFGGVGGAAPPPPPPPPNDLSHSIKCRTLKLVLSHADALVYIAESLVIVLVVF